MFGQSALAGRIAGETIGSICDRFDVDEGTKRGVQALCCSVAGSVTALLTLDPAGAALNLVQIGTYATGTRLPDSVLTSTLMLLGKKAS